MAENKKSIIVYADWIHKFEALTVEEAGRLIKHFFRYVNDLDPIAEDRTTELMFIDIKNTLKRDLIKYEDKAKTRSENAKLGNLKRYNEDLFNKVKANELELDKALELAEARKTSLSEAESHNTTKNVAKLADSVSVSDSVSDSVTIDKSIVKKSEDKKNNYSEKTFLENWSKCREFYLKKPTNIPKLNFNEKQNFKDALEIHTKNEIDDALKCFFMQKTKNIPSMYLRPTHFLSNVNKYFNAFLSNEMEIYGKENKTSKISL